MDVPKIFRECSDGSWLFVCEAENEIIWSMKKILETYISVYQKSFAIYHVLRQSLYYVHIYLSLLLIFNMCVIIFNSL